MPRHWPTRTGDTKVGVSRTGLPMKKAGQQCKNADASSNDTGAHLDIRSASLSDIASYISQKAELITRGKQLLLDAKRKLPKDEGAQAALDMLLYDYTFMEREYGRLAAEVPKSGGIPETADRHAAALRKIASEGSNIQTQAKHLRDDYWRTKWWLQCLDPAYYDAIDAAGNAEAMSAVACRIEVLAESVNTSATREVQAPDGTTGLSPRQPCSVCGWFHDDDLTAFGDGNLRFTFRRDSHAHKVLMYLHKGMSQSSDDLNYDAVYAGDLKDAFKLKGQPNAYRALIMITGARRARIKRPNEAENVAKSLAPARNPRKTRRRS